MSIINSLILCTINNRRPSFLNFMKENYDSCYFRALQPNWPRTLRTSRSLSGHPDKKLNEIFDMIRIDSSLLDLSVKIKMILSSWVAAIYWINICTYLQEVSGIPLLGSCLFCNTVDTKFRLLNTGVDYCCTWVQNYTLHLEPKDPNYKSSLEGYLIAWKSRQYNSIVSGCLIHFI